METSITIFFKALKYSEEANTLRKVFQAASHFCLDEENILSLEFCLSLQLNQTCATVLSNNKIKTWGDLVWIHGCWLSWYIFLSNWTRHEVNCLHHFIKQCDLNIPLWRHDFLLIMRIFIHSQECRNCSGISH